MHTRIVVHVTNSSVEMIGSQFFSSLTSYLGVTCLQKSILSRIRWRCCPAVLRTVARLHGECLILRDFNAPHFNWLTRPWSIFNSLFNSNKLLTAANEKFLHHAVALLTWYRTGHLLSTLDLVFSKYSSSILSIYDLAPLSKCGHDSLQVNFAVSKLLADKKLSKPKWRYN